MTKIYSVSLEMLAFWENWTHKEVGDCDLILPQFFYFDNSENQDPTNAPYKISAKYTKSFWMKSLFYWFFYF